MTIQLASETPADHRLIEHLMVILRGLRLSKDIDLAEAAIRAERQLTATARDDQRELVAQEASNGA